MTSHGKYFCDTVILTRGFNFKHRSLEALTRYWSFVTLVGVTMKSNPVNYKREKTEIYIIMTVLRSEGATELGCLDRFSEASAMEATPLLRLHSPAIKVLKSLYIQIYDPYMGKLFRFALRKL